jgi:hydroxymethylglutaryl-CoA synthase
VTRVGIVRAAGYVPRYRLSRAAIAAAGSWYDPSLKGLGKSERSVCDWDEDVITMATEAARHCLGPTPATPASLFLASTTMPFADRQNSAVVATALDLPTSTHTADLGHSQRAGTSALKLALEMASDGPRLVAAADMRLARTASPNDAIFGHGAAAVLVGTEQVIAEYLGGATLTRDFVDHFRRSGDRFDYYWEERWIRDEGYLKIAVEAIGAALVNTGIAATAVDRLVFAAPIRGVREAVAKATGIAPDRLTDELAGGVGDTGTAHPLMMLAHTLEQSRPNQVIVVVGFGQGADVLVFRTTDLVGRQTPAAPLATQIAAGIIETNYFKFLAFQGGLDVQWGMRAEIDAKTAISAAARHEEFGHFSAGKCPKCGTLQFPTARICVNPGCRHLGVQEPFRLADLTAKVASFTEDWLAFTPHPPGVYGMLEFDAGVKLMGQFTSDAAGRTQVGSLMRMVFRIKAIDRARGYTRYFWKAQPLEIASRRSV